MNNQWRVSGPCWFHFLDYIAKCSKAYLEVYSSSHIVMKATCYRNCIRAYLPYCIVLFDYRMKGTEVKS